jgi:hypothetical protein
VNAFALKLIKQALSTPKSKQELLQETKLPERTLRYNISILKKQGKIKELFTFEDLRIKIFSLTEIRK